MGGHCCSGSGAMNHRRVVNSISVARHISYLSRATSTRSLTSSTKYIRVAWPRFHVRDRWLLHQVRQRIPTIGGRRGSRLERYQPPHHVLDSGDRPPWDGNYSQIRSREMYGFRCMERTACNRVIKRAHLQCVRRGHQSRRRPYLVASSISRPFIEGALNVVLG